MQAGRGSSGGSSLVWSIKLMPPPTTPLSSWSVSGGQNNGRG